MFFLAATLVGWTGGDFVYRKVAAKNTREVRYPHNYESWVTVLHRAYFQKVTYRILRGLLEKVFGLLIWQMGVDTRRKFTGYHGNYAT